MTGREIEDAPTLPGISEGEILVIRSTRRKKSASAFAKVVALLSLFQPG